LLAPQPPLAHPQLLQPWMSAWYPQDSMEPQPLDWPKNCNRLQRLAWLQQLVWGQQLCLLQQDDWLQEPLWNRPFRKQPRACTSLVDKTPRPQAAV